MTPDRLRERRMSRAARRREQDAVKAGVEDIAKAIQKIVDDRQMILQASNDRIDRELKYYQTEYPSIIESLMKQQPAAQFEKIHQEGERVGTLLGLSRNAIAHIKAMFTPSQGSK